MHRSSCHDHGVLHVVTSGSPSGSPVTLIHGFTQTSAAWSQVTPLLVGCGYRVLAVDAPGHGGSHAIRASMEASVALLAATLETHHAVGPVVGYSMGGRLALHLALARPDLVTAVVLVSATPGIPDAAERAVRRAADCELADSLEREGLDAFLARWLALPLFATLAPERAGIDDRRANTASGLATSLRMSGTGSQASLWDRLRELAAVPALIVAGTLDTKYTDIAERMVTAIGTTAELRLLTGCGHACHLEAPEAFCEALFEFLASL